MALSDNLQGWWCPSLDTAGNGTTTLTDLSGNGKNASMVNMDADTVADTDDDTDSDGNQDAWVIEDGLRALRFVATDSAKATTPQATFGFGEDNFSVACWVKLETVDSGFVSPLIWGHPNLGGGTWFGFQKNSSDQWRFVVDDNVALRSVTNGSTVASGVWYHLVGTREYGGDIKFYLNNSLVGTVSDNGNSIANSNYDLLRFGYQLTVNDPFGQEFLNGCLDQVGVWDRVLTDTEVTQLYNGGRSLRLTNLSTGLQGWWCPSLDTAGNGTTTLTDLSGNGNNGTLTNMDAATDWVADTDNGGVRALDFDVAVDNQYVTTGDIDSTVITIGAWVKPVSRSQYAGVLSKRFGNTAAWAMDLQGTATRFYIQNGGYNIWHFQVPALSQWSLLCVSYSGVDADLKCYVNGVEVSHSKVLNQAGTDTPILLNDFPVTIGDTRGASHLDKCFDGLIDGCFVYNRALTSDEVSQLYNGGRSLNLLAGGTTQSIVPQLLLCRRCRSPIL